MVSGFLKSSVPSPNIRKTILQTLPHIYALGLEAASNNDGTLPLSYYLRIMAVMFSGPVKAVELVVNLVLKVKSSLQRFSGSLPRNNGRHLSRAKRIFLYYL